MANSLNISLERLGVWGYKGTVEFTVGRSVHYTAVLDTDDLEVAIDFLRTPAATLRTALEAVDGRREGHGPDWSARDRDDAKTYLDCFEETAKSVDELRPASVLLYR